MRLINVILYEQVSLIPQTVALNWQIPRSIYRLLFLDY
jgi:hypothetical protein